VIGKQIFQGLETKSVENFHVLAIGCLLSSHSQTILMINSVTALADTPDMAVVMESFLLPEMLTNTGYSIHQLN